MNNYQLICGSTVDLPKEHLDSRNIAYIPFHFNIDGVEYEDDFGTTITYDEFYKRIAEGAMPTTSQVNVESHIEFFEPFLKEGRDILYICFSSGLSGTYNNACLAAEELKEKYPERKVFVVDSLGASSGYGLLVDYIADLRDNGATIEEAYNWAEENKLKVHHWFFSTDLTHYRRGGRISATAAIFGTLLGVCPVLNVDKNGKLVPRKKVRGKKNAIIEVVKMMEQHAQEGLNYSERCYICHSACLEDAKAIADLVEDKFPNLKGKIMINDIGTVIGSHSGPGTAALFFMGDKRID